MSNNITKAFFCGKALYNYRNNIDSVVKKYDENYAKKYLHSMKTTKKYIFENFKEQEIIQNYYNFVAYHVMLVAVNYCFNLKNLQKNKVKILKEICKYDEFKEGIQKSNYYNISITRKITLFTLKHKLYILTQAICKYRQKQHKKG